MTKLKTFILSACAAALGFALALPTPSQTADAQTPDGETPAEESVCDVVGPGTGATPGLYGLCVAYCEAQDCEFDPDDENSGVSCENTAEKLLAKYDARRDEATDPPMPCLPVGADCPCWTSEFLSGLENRPYGRVCNTSSDEVGKNGIWTSKNSTPLYRGRVQTLNDGSTQCVFLELGGAVIVLPTTPDEHAQCLLETEAFCQGERPVP